MGKMLRIQCFEKNVKKKKNISVFLNLFFLRRRVLIDKTE